MEETTEQPASTESVPTPAEGETRQYADTSTSPEDGLLDASTEPETENEDDDGEEIDYDGEKYKIPKVLKDAFLRQQDYTQKTQLVAEQRREIEVQAQQVQHQAELQRQHVAEYAEAYTLDAQLKQYQQIDWQNLIDTDPVQAMKLDRQMRELQQRRDDVVASVTQKQNQQAIQTQQETAKRMNEGRALLEREIKGWSPEVAKELTAYGQTIGFTKEELAQVNNPRAVMLLHKAWQFDQLMKKQATPKAKPETQEKPITRITASKGTAVKSPSQMTDKEFAQWRQKQIKNRT
jgi:hypothetical protein